MPTHYLATTADGRIVSRKSTRNDFTHAAIISNPTPGRHYGLPNFSTSRLGAAKLFEQTWGKNFPSYDVVELRTVEASEYRAATKGINPATGRPHA